MRYDWDSIERYLDGFPTCCIKFIFRHSFKGEVIIMRKHVVVAVLLLSITVLTFSYFMYLELNDSSNYFEGRDTRKMFGDGSLQIGHSPGADILNDLEEHKVIEKEIYSYEQKGKFLYCYGRVGFTVISIKDKTIRQLKVNTA
ncbi:MAG: hypothetical protein H6Q72_1395 [Firmicutes bacterium]|nr:hypothetical protein [Bacillota bacterium]